MSQKVAFVLSDEALDIIRGSATQRKQGEFVSRAVVEYNRIKEEAGQEPTDVGVLEAIVTRLDRIEKAVTKYCRQAGDTTLQ